MPIPERFSQTGALSDTYLKALLQALPTEGLGMTRKQAWEAIGGQGGSPWSLITVGHALRVLVNTGRARFEVDAEDPQRLRRYWRKEKNNL